MAIIQSGATTDVMTVDPTFKAARTVIKPDEVTGYYQVSSYTGTLAATLAAGSPIFSMRYAPGGSTVCAIKRVNVSVIQNAAFTASQQVAFNLYVARSFSASDSGGTAISITGNSNKMRSSPFATSGMTDVRIASTGTLTAGTRTLDTNPLATVSGWATISTPAGLIISPTDIISHDIGDYPITLVSGEGIVLTNAILFPAAGTCVVQVNVEWFEASAY
jgi:hypothetical protein